MKITYYGHACFAVLINGKTLLFDPFIKQNQLAKNIDINSIAADYILLSHGHFDHVADALVIAELTGATIIAGYEVGEWCSKNGAKKVHLMNPGGRFSFSFGSVKLVSAVHSSSLPDGSYGGSPNGFVVETPTDNFYYAGDTALTMDMKLIPLTCPKLKVAILPIGDNFTMGINDAILASNFVECPHVFGVHYDTFGWIKIDHEDAVKKFAAAGKKLSLLEIGETRAF